MLRRGWRTAGVCAVLCLSAGAGFGIINGGSAGAWSTVFTVNDTSDLGLATGAGRRAPQRRGRPTARCRPPSRRPATSGRDGGQHRPGLRHLHHRQRLQRPDPPTRAHSRSPATSRSPERAAATYRRRRRLGPSLHRRGGATADISDLTIENGETVLGNSSESGSCSRAAAGSPTPGPDAHRRHRRRQYGRRTATEVAWRTPTRPRVPRR